MKKTKKKNTISKLIIYNTNKKIKKSIYKKKKDS